MFFNASTILGLKIGRPVSICPQQYAELSPHVNTYTKNFKPRE